MNQSIGRNDLCHCGSKKKYKKCHMEKDEVLDRKAREKAALNAAKVIQEKEKSEPEKGGEKKHVPQEKKGWFSQVSGKMGFIKNITQRRTPPSGNKGS